MSETTLAQEFPSRQRRHVEATARRLLALREEVAAINGEIADLEALARALEAFDIHSFSFPGLNDGLSPEREPDREARRWHLRHVARSVERMFHHMRKPKGALG